MKNYPVNNDYVQNLIEGLQTETRRRPEGTPMGDLQAADSENRREATQAHLNATEAEDGGSGVASDIEHGRWEPDIKDAGGSRQRKKVRGAKTPRPFKNTAGRILKKKIDESIVKNKNSKYPGRIGGSPGSVLPGAKNSELDSAKERFKKGLKLENAEVGYPERGIKGGTAEAKAYERKYKKKVKLQKESFDIADSRLSDEDAKIDQNVKTRGVKKVRGQKPVPMVNSAGETVGEQNSGTRPRSQDLNTRGRLNKSREGEGIIAKGKRFIKKKFS